jgi:predicted enzyme related to lactoylglutathione lyase
MIVVLNAEVEPTEKNAWNFTTQTWPVSSMMNMHLTPFKKLQTNWVLMKPSSYSVLTSLMILALNAEVEPTEKNAWKFTTHTWPVSSMMNMHLTPFKKLQTNWVLMKPSSYSVLTSLMIVVLNAEVEPTEKNAWNFTTQTWPVKNEPGASLA